MQTVDAIEEATIVGETVQTYVDLLNGLYNVQELPGLKFAQKVVENIDILEKELAPLNDALKPSKEFEVFAQKVRLEAGNDPKKVEELESQEPELVNARKKQLETVQEMLKATTEIELRKIYQNELPKEISAVQLKGIRKIIK
jgi:hypothetical protein